MALRKVLDSWETLWELPSRKHLFNGVRTLASFLRFESWGGVDGFHDQALRPLCRRSSKQDEDAKMSIAGG
jgi:hypothetical protein